MVNERTGIDLKLSPILEDSQVYIYVLLNSVGKVKVGQTTNIVQRIQSLSGSNGQGNEIIKCYLSPSTYLYTIEKVMHSKMSAYRIQDTEWFYYKKDDSGKILYNSAIKLLSRLFSSNDYENCNEERKKYCEYKLVGEKGNDN